MKILKTLGIDTVDFVVHTKENCPYCKQAKSLLSYFNYNVEFKENACEEWPTYPAIYKVDGDSTKLIGGFDELRKFLVSHHGAGRRSTAI